MKDLTEFAERQMVQAQKFLRTIGEAPPILAFETPTEVGVCAVPDYGNPAAKELCRAAMREMLKERGATRYAFICEAWVGIKAPDELKPGYLPSKDPERKEAIIVSAADSSGGKIVLTAIINRKDGLTFEESKSLGLIDGALLKLLDDTPETRH